MTTAELAHRGAIRSGNILSALILLSRPGILSLVALAGFSGMVMAAKGIPGFEIFAVTLFCLLVSAAGSVMINSVLDYHLDMKMPRLRARVEAINQAGRMRVMLLACTMIALSELTASLCLNALSAFLIAAAVMFYVGPYTLWLKRGSPYGVIPGGVPGALPVLVGYSAVAGVVRPEAMLLFLLVFLWQPPHFWIYALKHRNDYLHSGVPAMPAAMGEARTHLHILLFAAALLPASAALGFFAHLSVWYQLCAFLSGALLVISCLLHAFKMRTFSFAFRASIFYLIFIFLVIIAELAFFHIPPTGG